MSEKTIAVELTAREIQVLTCAMAGNFPATLNDARMPALRKLARASTAEQGQSRGTGPSTPEEGTHV
jgi:hypothetical protein